MRGFFYKNLNFSLFLFFLFFLILFFPQEILAQGLCFPLAIAEWKCEFSSPEDKILKRDCIKTICCTLETGCEEVAKVCGNPHTEAICNPWQSCIGPPDWMSVLPIVDLSFPSCQYTPFKASEWIKTQASQLKIEEKDITLWDGKGKVGEDENGNLLAVDLPVKFRWITKIPGRAGIGLDCGPDGFFIDIFGAGQGGIFALRRPLPLKEAFSELVPLREYQPPNQNKLYDEVLFEYRTMVEEVAFKDEKIYDFCPENPRNDDKTRDRYKLKEYWKKAFLSGNSKDIQELANFLIKFTHDNSLLEKRGPLIIHSSEYSPSLANTTESPFTVSQSWNWTQGVNFEKLKRALWGRVSGPLEYNEKFHVDVFQRRKQIEYFIPFKECKETTDESSEIGKKLKKLSEKYCTNRGGRKPNVSLNELIRDLDENSTTVAFVYSPSQDKYKNDDLISQLGQLLIDLNPGPCKIKTENTIKLPVFVPTVAKINISLYKEMLWGIVDSWTDPIGEKNFLVNPSPEPVGILVFRVFDPGYKSLNLGTTLSISPSTPIFPDDSGVVSEKIRWEIPTTTASTSALSFLSAIVERWVDPDWNGPDFLDVTKTQVRWHNLDYPVGGADFIDFQFCGQRFLNSPYGVQIKTKYRGEILLTDYDDSEKDQLLIRSFILDSEGEPLPKHQLNSLSSFDERWKELINTAYSEQAPRECVSVKEPPPTLLYSTVYYTWPFTARTFRADPGFLGAHFIPLSSDLRVNGKIFSWLGRHPTDRKLTNFPGRDNPAEEHAKWDTAFPTYIELNISGQFLSTGVQTHPLPPEYEIELCHPAQYPSRLRWPILSNKSEKDLTAFLSQFLPETQDLINILADEKVKEKCIQTNFLTQIPVQPVKATEWSDILKRVAGTRDEDIEECVKALTKAIQTEIDRKCPPNQDWLTSLTDPVRVPALKLELKYDWRNDTYYAGGAFLLSQGNWPSLPPFPHNLWWHDFRFSHFPAWPRVNGVQFRFVNLEKYTKPDHPFLRESSFVVSPWSQTWHFRLSSGYYKKEEFPTQNQNVYQLSFDLFRIEDLKKEIKLDPLFRNDENLLDAEKNNHELVVNRLQRMMIPQIGRTLSAQVMVKESLGVFGGISQRFRVALPIPRFASQLRYRPTESYLEQGRCSLQRFNFWQVWPAIVPWRDPDLLGPNSTDLDHITRNILEWYDNESSGVRPAGVNDISPETIREETLTNELYFYVLPCQDEFGKSASCYGWLGLDRDEKNRSRVRLVPEDWIGTEFKFRIAGTPPRILDPGTENFPGQNFTVQNLPPIKIPNKFVWNLQRGSARYLLEIAKGIFENSEELSLNARDLEPQKLGKREFSPPFNVNEVFLNFFKEEGPYTWAVRSCVDHCAELKEDETPSSSEKLWCGKTSPLHYFYGCFLSPPELPIRPSLGEIFLPGEQIEFSWDPVRCGDYPIYYELKVTYGIKDHRENRRNCEVGREVLHVFTSQPNFATSSFECLGTYHWAIRACVSQQANLQFPGQACTEWTTGDWSKIWYFNILTERVQKGGGTQFRICRECSNLLPNSCQDDDPQTPCGLRELVQLIFNILNCLLWCVSLLLLIILIGATGVILILMASDLEVLERVKTAWKGYGIGLLIMFLAWSFLNLIFTFLGWRSQIFGDWWNPFP